MVEVNCPHCGEAYDGESRTMTVRHEHKFCLTNPSGRKKKGKPTLSLRKQWMADRKKDLKS